MSDKINNWKSKMDDYYENKTLEELKKDLENAGFVIRFKDENKEPSIFPFYAEYKGESNPLSFINGKKYKVIGKEDNLYRIIDETEEDYLYSLKNFDYPF